MSSQFVLLVFISLIAISHSQACTSHAECTAGDMVCDQTNNCVAPSTCYTSPSECGDFLLYDINGYSYELCNQNQNCAPNTCTSHDDCNNLSNASGPVPVCISGTCVASNSCPEDYFWMCDQSDGTEDFNICNLRSEKCERATTCSSHSECAQLFHNGQGEHIPYCDASGQCSSKSCSVHADCQVLGVDSDGLSAVCNQGQCQSAARCVPDNVGNRCTQEDNNGVVHNSCNTSFGRCVESPTACTDFSDCSPYYGQSGPTPVCNPTLGCVTANSCAASNVSTYCTQTDGTISLSLCDTSTSKCTSGSCNSTEDCQSITDGSNSIFDCIAGFCQVISCDPYGSSCQFPHLDGRCNVQTGVCVKAECASDQDCVDVFSGSYLTKCQSGYCYDFSCGQRSDCDSATTRSDLTIVCEGRCALVNECSEDNPNNCWQSDDSGSYSTCNLTTNRCAPYPAACSSDSDCQGLSYYDNLTPVCSAGQCQSVSCDSTNLSSVCVHADHTLCNVSEGRCTKNKCQTDLDCLQLSDGVNSFTSCESGVCLAAVDCSGGNYTICPSGQICDGNSCVATVHCSADWSMCANAQRSDGTLLPVCNGDECVIGVDCSSDPTVCSGVVNQNGEMMEICSPSGECVPSVACTADTDCAGYINNSGILVARCTGSICEPLYCHSSPTECNGGVDPASGNPLNVCFNGYCVYQADCSSYPANCVGVSDSSGNLLEQCISGVCSQENCPSGTTLQNGICSSTDCQSMSTEITDWLRNTYPQVNAEIVDNQINIAAYYDFPNDCYQPSVGLVPVFKNSVAEWESFQNAETLTPTPTRLEVNLSSLNDYLSNDTVCIRGTGSEVKFTCHVHYMVEYKVSALKAWRFALEVKLNDTAEEIISLGLVIDDLPPQAVQMNLGTSLLDGPDGNPVNNTTEFTAGETITFRVTPPSEISHLIGGDVQAVLLTDTTQSPPLYVYVTDSSTSSPASSGGVDVQLPLNMSSTSLKISITVAWTFNSSARRLLNEGTPQKQVVVYSASVSVKGNERPQTSLVGDSSERLFSIPFLAMLILLMAF